MPAFKIHHKVIGSDKECPPILKFAHDEESACKLAGKYSKRDGIIRLKKTGVAIRIERIEISDKNFLGS